MNASVWATAKAVIAEALARPESEREEFLDSACGDARLRTELRTLFAENTPQFLTDAITADRVFDTAAPTEPAVDYLEPATFIGPYAIIEQLGAGGMGRVYLANDTRLKRRVALKCLLSSKAGGTERRARILQEARAAARISHPNVATVYDIIEHGDRAFIVMEYVEGENLARRMRRERLPLDRVLAIGRQLTAALAAAHAQQIVHRDLKPGNIQLTRDETAKVLDFGVAQAISIGSPTTDGATMSSPPAVRWMGGGTPAYMSPEQILGRPVDQRSDIYSLGIVLFEMTTGRRPYQAGDPIELLSALSRPIPRADAGHPEVPRALADAISKALAVEPDSRYESAAAVGEALDAVDRMLGRKRSPWTRWRQLAGLGIIVGLAALAVWIALMSVLKPAPAPQATLAIPPVNVASTDQANLDELGTLLQSVLSRNLAALPGIRIVQAALPIATGPIVAASQASPTADYTASVMIRRGSYGLAADVGLWHRGDTAQVWQKPIEGLEIGLLRSLVDGLATELEATRASSRTVDDDVRTRMRHLPTADDRALLSYLQGRTVLDTSEDEKTDNQAATLFQDAIRRDKSFAFAQAGLSQAYSSRFKHTRETLWLVQAKDAANRALELDPQSDQAHLALAVVHLGESKDDAILEARQAVRLTPDSDDAHRILGLALISQGQSDTGFAELLTATALMPRHWMNYYALGRSLLAAHKYREAVDALQKVRDHLPGFESAYVNLGLALMSLGKWDLAVGNLERAVQLDNKDHYALNNLATAYYWNRQFEKALGLYREAITNDAQNPKQFMNLGDAYEALRRGAEARIAYTQAVKLADAKRVAGFDPATEAIAAKCQAKLGIAGAEGRALAALAADDKNADVLFKLAVIYALSRQTDRALDRLEQAVNFGYPPVFIRDDPDLHVLSNQPRFKRLVAQSTG